MAELAGVAGEEHRGAHDDGALGPLEAGEASTDRRPIGVGEASVPQRTRCRHTSPAEAGLDVEAHIVGGEASLFHVAEPA